MKLYKHQQDIVDEDPKYKGLWLGTGSGKTRVALLLAKGKTLVICPKTQRDDKNWQRELEKIEKDLELVVLSKEDFRKVWKELPVFETVICDEAHTLLGVTPSTMFRNREEKPKASQLFYALNSYVKRTRPERLYLLTATLVKSPMTVWGAGVILNVCNINSFFEFRNTFYTQIPIPNRKVYAPRKNPELKERLAKFVHKLGYVGRLEDYFDVPDQTYKNEYVELTTKQKEDIKEATLEYPDPIVLIGKKNQIENDGGNKTQRIIDYSYEFPKMIVFCKYTKQIEDLKTILEKEGREVYTMTGKTKDRGELLQKLSKLDEYVFIVQAQISAGWELPDCPVMIFASRTYSFVDYEQAQGRILRANALKKNLYINLMVKYKGSIDMAVNQSLLNKEDFSEQIYVKTGEQV